MSLNRVGSASRNGPAPGRLEAKLGTSLIVVLVLVYALVLALNTEKRTAGLTELYPRILISTTSLLNSDIHPEYVFDRSLQSAWWEEMPVGDQSAGNRHRITRNLQHPLPDPQTLQLTVEAGITHFPDNPPRPNRLLKFLIWNGYQKDQKTFRDYARPKKIHLIFFLQDLVDVDREYRIPGAPRFWRSKTVLLEDRPGVQSIDLDFLPPSPPSPRFPVRVSQIWMRLLIESCYPGQKFPHRPAVSEIDFLELHPTHKALIWEGGEAP